MRELLWPAGAREDCAPASPCRRRHAAPQLHRQTHAFVYAVAIRAVLFECLAPALLRR